MSTALESRKAIQRILAVAQDGVIGHRTLSALQSLTSAPDESFWPAEGVSGQIPDSFVHHVKATSFADPADVAAFKRCKGQGKTDQECFKVGDNGIGKWGDDCTGPTPICALPPEKWQHLANPRGAKVLVVANKASVVCELRDTMPREENITNGAGLDLNEAACTALGLRPPLDVQATWQFI